MDKFVYLSLYNWAKKNKVVNCINLYTVKFSSKFFFAAYSFTCIILILDRNSKIIIFLLAPLFLLITNTCLRKLFKRVRPYEKLDLDVNGRDNKESFSFPSNHAACSSVIATVIFFINPTLGIFLIICSVITGISRVIAGIHYPSDIVAGWSIGALFGMIGFYI